MCVGLVPPSSVVTDMRSHCLDQTPPPRELKVSDPKVRDLSLLQLQLVPRAVLHIKFLDEPLNRELLSKQPIARSGFLVDDDVQAPLVPCVLAAAIDLPLLPNTNEPDEKTQSGGGRTLGSSSAGSSASSQREKSKNLGPNTTEAQKKFGKFFKGLGPSKEPTLSLILRLILFLSTRNIGLVS